jgi:hypothetical protein
MMCENCSRWAATTDVQLANRLRNMASMNNVGTHSCPNCGGTEWATTHEMIDRAKLIPHDKYSIRKFRVSAILLITFVLMILWWVK